MNHSRFVMTVVMLFIFTGMVAVATTYPGGARFMVFVVGFPAIALCLLQLTLDWREWRNERRATGAPLAAAPKSVIGMDSAGLTVEAYTPEVVRKELIVWGYIFALIGSILLFGFYIAVPVFLVAFLRFFAQASWTRSLLLPAGVCAFIYVMLTYLFRMTVHTGFVTDFLRDRISG